MTVKQAILCAFTLFELDCIAVPSVAGDIGSLISLEDTEIVLDVAFSNDGNLIAWIDVDGLIAVWNRETSEYTARIASGRRIVTALAFINSDAEVVGVDTTGRLHRWSLSGGGHESIRLVEGALYCIDIAEDGKRLICGGFEFVENDQRGVLIEWNRESNESRLLARDVPFTVRHLTISSDESTVAYCGFESELRTIRIDAEGLLETAWQLNNVSADGYYGCQWIRIGEGEQLVLLKTDGTKERNEAILEIRDRVNGQLIHRSTCPGANARYMAVDDVNNRVATVGTFGAVILVSIDDDHDPLTIDVGDLGIRCIEVSPFGDTGCIGTTTGVLLFELNAENTAGDE